MRKLKREKRKMGLTVLVVLALMINVSGFTSFAADLGVPTEKYEEKIDVEVLEATIIEDFDKPSDIDPYTMLTSCIIGVSGASDGMHIDISTGTVGTASVLGVKDVKIQKKTWYGGWTTVAVSSGGESYNCANMGINILYSNAVKDATYKITCVHYGNVNGYTEGENDSGEFVFTY